MLSLAPSSIILAISTSPSRLSRETSPISRRYIFTGSPVLPTAGKQPEDILALDLDPFVRRLLDDQLFPFVRVDDIDILLAEEHDDIIDLIGGDDVGGEQIIDVVIGEKPLLLSQRDQLLEFIGFYLFCHIGFSR